MKWIGQHIWSFISRFRSDVYLENVAESAQDHVVGIDADGKLYKQDVSTGDITGVTAGDALTGGGTSGAVTINHEDTSSQASANNSGSTFIQDVTLDTYGHVTGLTSVLVPHENNDTTGTAASVTDAAQPNITTMTGFLGGTANALITDDGDGTVTSESGLTFSGTALASTAAIHTQINSIVAASMIQNTGNNNLGGQFTLSGNRAGADAQDNDILGTILFSGLDDGTPSAQNYGQIQTKVADATSGQEAGKMEFAVAEFDGSLTTVGLLLDGDTDANGEIDVTIGAGAASTSTIAGNLVVTGIPIVGWHGSHTTIKILHSDFSADDGGRPVMIDDSDSGNENFYLKTHAAFKAYATIAIPTGYKATHVMVYGTNTPAVEVWEHQINSKTGASKGTGNVDTEFAITNVTSSSTNYLLIQVAQASGDEIHGGYVTIAKV